MTSKLLVAALVTGGLLVAGRARAADPKPAPSAPPAQPASPAETASGPDAATVSQAPDVPDDPDMDVNKAQPDFALSALPTTLRLPRHRMAFRLTHRFYQPLNSATVGDLFGLDSGAQIGLEFRYGLFRGTQVGFYRTSDRTIEFFSEFDVHPQRGRMPVGIAAYGSIEGTNNFRDRYSPALGLVVSRELGSRAAAYVEPIWVNNSDPGPGAPVDHNSTFMAGLGLRVRVLEATYVVAEVAPRAAGYRPGTTHASIGIEKRVGGHLFQLTFSNSQGTTMAQVARGGPTGNDWALGFNLARKFY